jgi:subtilisin family serine protease
VRIGRPLFVGSIALALVASLGTPASPGSAEPGFHLVRFEERITDESRAALAATGTEILGYEPHHAYLVLATPAQARAATRIPAVRSVTPLPASRRLHPTLRAREGIGPVEVTARTERVAAVIGSLPATSAVVTGQRRNLTTAILSLPAAAARSVAAHPGVLYVAPTGLRLDWLDELTDQIQAGNLNADRTAPVPGYVEWLDGLGLSGEGEIIAVVDTGIQELHPDLQDKLVARYEYTMVPEPGDTFGHGTHVVGAALGDPPLGTMPADLDGFTYGTGVAPGARFVDQKMGWTGSRSAVGLETTVEDAWRAGARIQNNSWSIISGGTNLGQVEMTRAADVLVRDADPTEPGPQPINLVFSAGNEGENSIGVPQEAKNLISVGATESGRLYGGTRLVPGGDIDQIARFSTLGPTSDGRVYPTVVAPGERIAGQRSFENVYMSTNGACVAPPEGAGLYCVASGTSFAAPHVSGAAALIREWWSERHGPEPSPAMVKALLVNGATDLKERDIPNPTEGWGRVNLSNVFGPTPGRYVDQSVVLGGPGERHETSVVVAEEARPLRVTLAWSDAPASLGADPALVNDLDLVVELLDGSGSPVQTWRGNVFVDGATVTGGSPDRLNNVENVFLDEAPAGTYRVTVIGHNVPGDGVPFTEDPTDQDFALAVRGALDPPSS